MMRLLAIIGMSLAISALGGCDDEGGDADADADVDADVDVDADSDADVVDDADVPPCTETIGEGSLSGTYDGEALAASSSHAAWIAMSGVPGYSIALGDAEGTCEEVEGAAATAAAILFVCDDRAGSYVAGASCNQGTGVSFRNSIRLRRDDGTVDATEGTITIEALDPDCGGTVRGSFEADFEGDAVSGTFDTVSCGRAAL